MRLKFKSQDFQTEAVNAVVELFKGQEKADMTFSITDQQSFWEQNQGIGNRILISLETLNDNLHTVQKAHSLPQTDISDINAFPVSVEMETGTGKTFVYTQTILELNKRYGFKKFIVVVPSVAIREGVFKSFQMTSDYFKNQYDSLPYRFFIYQSERLSDVRAFAVSDTVEIMVINIDAFRKAENVINQPQDKLNGDSAMRYIRKTCPVVIIDEPQSVDNTPKAKEAIASLKPLCVLRYSATHREKQNLVYRLTPVDAYQKGLVKQISVISNSVINDYNKPYICLKSVSNKNGFSAKVEIDVENSEGSVKRKTVVVKPHSDLYVLSGGRKLYENYKVEGIDCSAGFERIEFSNAETLTLNENIGDIDDDVIKRAQIRHTIKTHLDKELRCFDKGIKVLSLFFVDKVEKYRTADGQKGVYAEMFEACYNELMNNPKYAPLKEKFNTDVNKAHNGYFSQDKKGKYKDTNGSTQADNDTYNTIMKNKEWLLSFDCPLRFIFSHSALKEGWDNPNVFQVCTLTDQKSVFTCRQKIGRGLRLCVNQAGERIEDKNINILHVVANESFSEFAGKLQKEIENETGVQFGTVTEIPIRDAQREVSVRLKKQILASAEFLELWNRIKQKTTYRVRFDVEKLIEECASAIKAMPETSDTRLVTQTADLIIQNAGVSHQERAMFTTDLERNDIVLPDILRLISAKTLLKRSTVSRILQQSGRLEDFLKNPQKFYEETLKIIKEKRHALAIDGIKYIRLAGREYYVQEIFESMELIAYLDKNAVAVANSVYDYVVYDSSVESDFARSLDNDPDVKMFFKMPNRFKIETPIGAYNPDWAVYLEKNGEERLYFVLETKGTEDIFKLRPEERQKIHCGAEHFKALSNVVFSNTPVMTWKEFKQNI